VLNIRKLDGKNQNNNPKTKKAAEYKYSTANAHVD